MLSARIAQCPQGVPAGVEMTKLWRHGLFGAVSGGAGSTAMEQWQRKQVEDGTGVACPKTKMRINVRTKTLHEIAQPNRRADGFDFTEDFDGVQTFGQTKVYLDFKSIVSAGGAQTRSLREVHHFVEGQLDVAKTTSGILFANLLDGDESASHMDKFENLKQRPEYADVRDRVYVGDTRGYFTWLQAQL